MVVKILALVLGFVNDYMGSKRWVKLCLIRWLYSRVGAIIHKAACKHLHLCSAVNIAILREKGLLCQERRIAVSSYLE